MSQALGGINSGFEKILKGYKDAGKPFQVSTRPYFSSGGFFYRVVDQVVAADGTTKLFLELPLDSRIEFFSYGIGDAVNAVGLGGDPRAATFVDTNLVQRTQTNNEDFVIEGLSATARGFAPVYPDAAPAEALTNATWLNAIITGQAVVQDIGANIQPPEAVSPLALEDAVFRGLLPHVEMRTLWSRKEGDFLGLVDQMPEGGAKSYLRSSGEPNVFDYYRMPEGLIWRREGATQDTILTIGATVRAPHLVLVTLPANLAAELVLGNPTGFRLVWKLRCHGRAFYYPSRNS